MQVVNISKANLKKIGYSDLEEWLKNPNNVYIGRHVVYVKGANKSKWSNPFSVNKLGREECLKSFKNFLLNDKILLNQLGELKGKTLGCWCKPEKCHGDILIELINKK